MSDRLLPQITDAIAYWDRGKVQLVLHSDHYRDDRNGTLTPTQALKLAEALVRAAREATT